MSKETIAYLNANTLIGDTEVRGNAWHYRATDDNHFPRAVPLDRAEALLTGADPITIDEPCECGCGATARVLKRKSNGHRYGTFTAGYQPHLYAEWLVKNVSILLDDTLHISSVGLLKGGAQAWVQVQTGESVVTTSGLEILPNLTAYTSFDGSLATGYQLMQQAVVCDNTLSAGMAEGTAKYKRRHTSKSGGKMNFANARETLGIMFQNTTAFAEEIDALAATAVSDKQWAMFLDAHVPTVDLTTGEPLKGRGLTIANNERDQLTMMWNTDTRVSPWRNTALGVAQAVNTYAHHFGTVKNVTRAERNMSNAIKGITAKADLAAMGKLSLILAA